MAEHLIGLTLGAEDDWPVVFESLLKRANLNIKDAGRNHTFSVQRIPVEPFSLAQKVPYRLIIDRAAWWYFAVREWLKKAAIMDDTYLLNNPFTFQAMEKHTAYAAMIRLGLRIPETWLIPYKVGPTNDRYPLTSQRYNKLFNLDAIAESIGYPLFMKPFDGGGWRGVSKIDNAWDLHKAYDESGQSLMHLQKGLLNYEHFIRSLTIGPQTRIMKYRPERPMHERYDTVQNYLTPAQNTEITRISQLVNTFFRWEFNSCESILKDGVISPIDYANACPDVAIISLHVHFPWAMLSLLKWSLFCAATGRPMAIDLEQRRFFAIGDRTDLNYNQKLTEYQKLTDAYFEVERFTEFCRKHLSHLDEVAFEYFTSPDFDTHLIRSVAETFRPHEHDYFISAYRHMFSQWAAAQRTPATV